jgi:hypothetical protein
LWSIRTRGVRPAPGGKQRCTLVEDIALAAAGDWAGVGDAVQKLAKELGTSPDDVQREIRKRRGGS